MKLVILNYEIRQSLGPEGSLNLNLLIKKLEVKRTSKFK